MIALRRRMPAACCIAAMMVAMAACENRKGPEGERIDSTASDTARDSVVTENLPEGRFQIPTAHTPAPDFFITLPEGYTVKNNSRMPNDDFFIIRLDDPSLGDSSVVTPGFMRIYVGVNAASAFDSTRSHSELGAMIGKMPVTWRIWSEPLPDRGSYYVREIASSDFFAPISAELARSPLHLQIYVAGADSTRIAELMRAAESLSLAP